MKHCHLEGIDSLLSRSFKNDIISLHDIRTVTLINIATHLVRKILKYRFIVKLTVANTSFPKLKAWRLSLEANTTTSFP